MRTSWVKLYAPFLVLALVQGMFIAVAPSRGEGQQSLATLGDAGQFGGGGGVGGGSDLGGSFGDGTGVDLDGDGVADPGTFDSGSFDSSGNAGTSSGGASTAGSGSGGVVGTDPGASGGSGASGGGGSAAVAGDTSHCKGDLQHDVTRTPPPCLPKWSGNNGGATYQGVTDKEITIVYFSSKPNEQVDAVLAPQGLATSEEENVAAMEAYVNFINKHMEMYGRKVKWIRVVGDCPTTPPDYDKCNAAAAEVVKLKPFAVIWGTSLYASVFQIWAEAGIISLGGQHFEEKNFFQRFRPFRYDTFMGGTQSADHIAEYYCKKMAKGTATHAGQNIHATIGGRDTPRKLGVVVPEIPANVENAKRVLAKVEACGGQTSGFYTYESNIETATQQTTATIQKQLADKMTTVVCMCDPIAPAFYTAGLDGAKYYPEFLMPGLGLLDYDKLGRLYAAKVMEHAFGPSHLGLNIPLDDTDQGRAWRDVGNEGHPCGDNGCGILWSYVATFGAAVHMAGPNLNPLTFEQALLERLPDSGGTPESPLADWGPNDYTGLGDAKEVYWSNSARSSLDGQPRAFVPVAGGKRYRLGQWPTGLDQIPVPAS